MSAQARAAYFDSIADAWDGWENLDGLAGELASGLEELGVGAEETVVDVGCGTGNLTRALLARLSGGGRVVAVDLSPRMIEVARRKTADPRVLWHTVDARCLPLEDGSCDRAICCSVWPHFDDPAGIAAELGRVLRPAGWMHVWHLIPRERVNAIHASAGEAVRADVLGPADETARLLARAGFRVSLAIETATRYLVSASKPAR